MRTLADQFTVKVVGVSFADAYPKNLHFLQGVVRQVGELRLVREPENEYDANAIAVVVGGETKVGHVPRWMAEIMAPLMDTGERYLITHAEVLVHPDHEDHPGLLVKVERGF